MYIIATASADTYITNKIVDGFMTKDANVGRAGTLDLFKLYNETISGSTGYHTELSRVLIKFDLGRIRQLASGSLDFSSNTFGAKIRLKQVETNLPVPRNFTISLFPLARQFDEGDGRDVASFADVDTCNFLSSSLNTAWSASGAYASGSPGDTNIDYFASGNLFDGLGLRNFEVKQSFIDGNEDLFVDVSDIVSATLAGILPDYGMIMSFTSSQENDLVTRFVKRFASRHVTQDAIRPRLEVYNNNSIFDSHESATFDASGSLYLRNIIGSTYQNVLSASIAITGSNSMKLVLSTGSYTKIISASQQTVGQNFITGSYFAPFYISAQDQTIVSGSIKLSDHISSSGSIVFLETWSSLDSSVIFLSNHLTCSIPNRSTLNAVPRQLIVKSTNLKSKYDVNPVYKVRGFAYDPNYEPAATRIPKSSKSAIPETYFSIKDIDGNVYIPFERNNGGTRLSVDEYGMFFDLFTDGLPRGRLLTIQYLVIDLESEYIVDDKNAKFIVEK